MEFGFGPGAAMMLTQGIQNEKNEDYSIYLNGDLCQMAAQKDFLIRHGVSVKFNNVYPCVRPCDKEKTFKLLWKYKCQGWWHYDEIYEELGICTKEEFGEVLNKQCDKEREEWQREKTTS